MTKRALACAASLSVMACAPSVHLPKAEVGVPPAFEVSAAQGGPQVVPLDAWWTGFADPQLVSLIDLAFVRSTTARLAYARIAEARATRDQARATTLPTGSLTGGATVQGSESLWGPGLTQPSATSFTAGFQPSWEIDLFGRLAATRSRADIDYRSAALDFYGARLALAGDVAGSLFQARFTAVQLANARETLTITSDLTRTGELGFERGLTSGQDAARLRADLASAEAEVVRLEAELRVAKRLLLIDRKSVV